MNIIKKNFFVFILLIIIPILPQILYSDEPKALKGKENVLNKRLEEFIFNRPVMDTIGLLTDKEKGEIERRIYELEKEKGSQIGVLIVKTTKPETIEEYSIRVVEKWKLGRKGVDDGVLLLIAKEDRRVRIEVGYGLEGVIPDAMAKRIIREYIIPYFKVKRYYEGILSGVDALIHLIQEENLIPPLESDKNMEGSDIVIEAFLIFLGTFFFIGVWRSISDTSKLIKILFIVINILIFIFFIFILEITEFFYYVILYFLQSLVNLLLFIFFFPSTSKFGSSYYSSSWSSRNLGTSSDYYSNYDSSVSSFDSFSGGGGGFGGGGASGSW